MIAEKESLAVDTDSIQNEGNQKTHKNIKLQRIGTMRPVIEIINDLVITSKIRENG